jgi:hypothetical protein
MNNAQSKYRKTIKFAVLSDYTKAVYPTGAQADHLIPRSASDITHSFSYEGDLMPYSDGDKAYWTGYYSSRPLLKKIMRQGEAALKHANVFYTLAYQRRFSNETQTVKKLTEMYNAIQPLLNAVNDATHHDAITGTAKQFVVYDYIDHLNKGMNEVYSTTLPQSLLLLASKSSNINTDKSVQFHSTLDQVIKSDGTIYPIIISNSLSWNRQNEFIRIKTEVVNNQSICIYDSSDKLVQSTYDLEKSVTAFVVDQIPAFGYSTYFAKKCASSRSIKNEYEDSEEVQFIENEKIKVNFCKKDQQHKLCSIFNKRTGVTTELEQNFLSYSPTSTWGSQNSGAYIFVPTTPQPKPIQQEQYEEKMNKESTTHQQFYQKYSKYVKQTFRVLPNTDYVEIELTIIGTPAEELVTRFSTKLANNKVLYVDKNGLEMRRWDYQTDSIPASQVAKNFLPMVYSSYIQDKQKRFSVISSQAYGVSSQENGALEVMLHRNCPADDGRGLGEALLDNSEYTSIIRIKIDDFTTEDPQIYEHHLIHELNNPLQLTIAETKLDKKAYSDSFNLRFAPLEGNSLSEHVQILSLETEFKRYKTQLEDPKIILRVQHFGTGEQQEQTINVTNILLQKPFNTVFESSLATQIPLSKKQSASQWKSTISVQRNQIRTYIAQIDGLSPNTGDDEDQIAERPVQSGSIILYGITMLVTVVTIGFIGAAVMYLLKDRRIAPEATIDHEQLVDEEELHEEELHEEEVTL